MLSNQNASRKKKSARNSSMKGQKSLINSLLKVKKAIKTFESGYLKRPSFNVIE